MTHYLEGGMPSKHSSMKYDLDGHRAVEPRIFRAVDLAADPYHTPVVLSRAEFRALPHITTTVHNGHRNADETYSGVPLATLLALVSVDWGKGLEPYRSNKAGLKDE